MAGGDFCYGAFSGDLMTILRLGAARLLIVEILGVEPGASLADEELSVVSLPCRLPY